MEKISLSQASQATLANKNKQEMQKETVNSTIPEKKNGKKLLALGASAISAITIAGLLIAKKTNKAKEVTQNITPKNDTFSTLAERAKNAKDKMIQTVEEKAPVVKENITKAINDTVQTAKEKVSTAGKSASKAVDGAIQTAREKVPVVKEDISKTVNSAIKKADEKTATIRESASKTVGSAIKKADKKTSTARESASKAINNTAEKVRIEGKKLFKNIQNHINSKKK